MATEALWVCLSRPEDLRFRLQSCEVASERERERELWWRHMSEPDYVNQVHFERHLIGLQDTSSHADVRALSAKTSADYVVASQRTMLVNWIT